MSTVKREKEATAYKSLVAAEKAFLGMLCIAIELFCRCDINKRDNENDISSSFMLVVLLHVFIQLLLPYK